MSFRSPNPSPLTNASAWSRFFHRYVFIMCIFQFEIFVLFFLYISWISYILKKSHKQGTLHPSDLYDIPSHLESSKVTEQLETSWFDEMKRSPQNPSLIRATIYAMGWTPLLIGFLLIPMVNIIKYLLLIIAVNFYNKSESSHYVKSSNHC
jgi:hypothetical protein